MDIESGKDLSSREELDQKRKFGAFYTHSGLTDLICEWAINRPDCTVLEPSFGECGFLRSAHDRLLSLNVEHPSEQIFGCDIDPDAFGHLSRLFEEPVDLKQFYKGDFVEQQLPPTWRRSFGAVVGNPPYLPCRKISHATRKAALLQLEDTGLRLSPRASLWAYFVALSIPLTKGGGRMAWVLPGSFLYANYSKGLRTHIARSFEEVRAFALQERQFLLQGTEEISVVLLAKDKKSQIELSKSGDIALTRCEGVKGLAAAIQKWESGRLTTDSHCGSSAFDALSRGPRELFEQLRQKSCCSVLGEHLRIRIGLVTGNNHFFLLDEQRRESAGLRAAETVKLLSRFRFATGLSFSAEDLGELLAIGGEGNLISVKDAEDASDAMKSYLNSYPAELDAGRSTFKKRRTWCAPDDGHVPDAFFPVMQHFGPRLVLNAASVNCTNSVHRAYFNGELAEHRKQLISLATLTTFSQVAAEICGRSYGSGVLKHEPREVEAINILLPSIHHGKVKAAFTRADQFLRVGSADEAMQVADNLIYGAIDDENAQTNAVLLRAGLRQLRGYRHR